MEFDAVGTDFSSISEKKCTEFVEALYSKAAVPGGGGAAALVGAIGTALAGMVCNLTTGKKKYAEYEEDIQRILKEAQVLQDRLLAMIDEDAKNFMPLAKAYGLPKETEEEKAYKEKTLEECTKVACSIPLEIVEVCYKAVLLQEELVGKGSALAISDVACGVQCLRAGMISGWVNVLINIKTIKDAAYVADVNNRIKPMLDKGVEICDRVYADVEKQLS
ncbi:cyclodeaminase/cyclohydrolase family protein [Acetobacterium sp.]|jgi:formiminotetrahydrofolate cyclodeaminase|uniref:cyclodeaminase/cyclohydrolase family protein n=1 Tax=Acetobacterium sp. TaxID=1872094 RepID=UPI000CA85ECC|nr:cyclodeaminase/cyclohydrolase family protein [Acetobacterium sp.]MDO9493659.1 cyclodeaminase/cyclohydrolase family protein [Acetobacterium sp.]PKM49262.1 MAG: sugar ABC transporter substrate-binding protein [Firmicutes bacterium HGW-Firmicutes-6]PKM53589.1 MAG: sugar ABC transporter substrate-binding protein [Firmicutes bacterium HGW-Firmicutes-3]